MHTYMQQLKKVDNHNKSRAKFQEKSKLTSNIKTFWKNRRLPVKNRLHFNIQQKTRMISASLIVNVRCKVNVN